MGEVNIRRIELLNTKEVKKFVDKYPNDMELGRKIRELFTPTQDEKEYLEHWTCEYCGKHTHEIEYDYMVGTNHLQCELESSDIKFEINGC
tara:strand:- start:257 stop:529 length:273 start_codon:yes stop_codon:yes gene_type:complete